MTLFFLVCLAAFVLGIWHATKSPKNERVPGKVLVPLSRNVETPKEPLREGFSRYESKPQVLVDGIQIKTGDGATSTIPFQVTSSLVIERDEVFADLNRRATDAKAQKDWSTAIELLQQAKARQGDEYQEPRLALFLQQAGRFDEAMVEIEWLLAQVSSQCNTQFSNASTVLLQFSIASRYASIHEKARLICHREKRHEMATSHQTLHEQFRKKADALGRRMDRERQKKHQAVEKLKEARAIVASIYAEDALVPTSQLDAVAVKNAAKPSESANAPAKTGP